MATSKFLRTIAAVLVTLGLLAGCASGGGGYYRSSPSIHMGMGVGYGWGPGYIIDDRPIIVVPPEEILPPEPVPVPLPEFDTEFY